MILKLAGISVVVLECALLVHAAPQDAQRQTLDVSDQCSIALDGAKKECWVTLDGDGTQPKAHSSGKEWDFWFDVSGKTRVLHPLNRVAFAKVGATEVGKAGCEAAIYKRGPFPVGKLSSGSHICVHTGDGRYAEITIESEPDSKGQNLRFAYVLWN